MNLPMKLNVRIAATVLLATLTGFGQTPKHVTPTLQETEQWINKSFENEKPQDLDCQEYGPGGRDISCLGWKYMLNIAKCKVSLLAVPSEGNGSNTQGRGTEQFTFDLKDIDPETIIVEPWYATVNARLDAYGNEIKTELFHHSDEQVKVKFGTTNGADAISISFPTNPSDHVYKDHKLCCGAGEGITLAPTYAPRFAKAFRHAAELCGGKASAF